MSQMAVEKWREGNRLAPGGARGKEGAVPETSMARIRAIADVQRRAKDEFWRKVLSDPETYGDEMLKARALVAHYTALLARAQRRLDYLVSLSQKAD